jgi:hypothetical protein
MAAHCFWDHVVDKPTERSYIVRHASLGHYCGYVQVAPDHPGYGKNQIRWWDPSRIELRGPPGGVSYADFERVLPGKMLFLVGFDCSSFGPPLPWIHPPGSDQRKAVVRVYKNIAMARIYLSRLEWLVSLAYQDKVFDGQMSSYRNK